MQTDSTTKPRRVRRGFLAVLAGGTMLAGLGGYAVGQSDSPAIFANAVAAPAPITAEAAAPRPMVSFADLAEKVKPAVVQITSTRTQRMAGNPIPPQLRGTPFEDFFRRFGNQDGPQMRRGHALGSGFVIDPAGHIVTNNHVIGNADEIQVTLASGESFDAKLVGRDEKTDLAVLKIDAKRELPFVEFGGDDELRIGDWVMAVGNPFGLDGTVTVGVLSARGRNIGAGPYDDFLQIDAPINSGNSGGPTFDLKGRVIGVNTAIASPSGGNVGIGFATPAALAQPVIDQLIKTGQVERGWLGVQMQTVTPPLAQAMRLDKAEGALVAAIVPDSPAARSSLQQGDIITGFAGQKIAEPRDLARAVASASTGQPVELTVLREGKQQTVQVRLEQLKQQSASAGQSDTAEGQQRLGLTLAPLNGSARTRLGIEDDVSGAVITAVEQNSPAAEVGLRAGDVISQVAGKKVASPNEVAQAIKSEQEAKRETTALLIVRDGTAQYVALPLAQG